MKNIIFIIPLSLLMSYACIQHSAIERIRTYYHGIDKHVLVDSLRNYYLNLYGDSYAFLGYSMDSVFLSKKHYWEQVRGVESVVMLVPMLRNAKDYTFKKDVYDFIDIDTTDICVQYCNVEEGKVSTLEPEDYSLGAECSGEKLDGLRNLMNFIEKEKPDVLLTSGVVFSDFSSESTNENYLYIKNNMIYVYRSKYKDVYELNSFIHKFFSERKFRKRAIYDEKLRTDSTVLYGSGMHTSDSK